MILPTKHLSEAECLLAAGALLLNELNRPRTVTELWEAVASRDIPFDRFVLAAEMLYAIGVIRFRDGLLEKKTLSSVVALDKKDRP